MNDDITQTTQEGIADDTQNLTQDDGQKGEQQHSQEGGEPGFEGGIADDPTQTGEGGEEGKPKIEQKPEPEAYELSVTEDFPMPNENLSDYTATCRELGLTKAQAEGLLGWHKKQYLETNAYNEQQEKAVLAEWNSAILADKDFGGSNYKATIAQARRGLELVDPDGSLRQFLRVSKGQFHPDVIRAAARIGRLLSEHGFVGQNGEGGQKALLERHYPTMS